ncbi:Fc.00g078500.m01.CDS01 [Cosmosporella sp. VM-42]
MAKTWTNLAIQDSDDTLSSGFTFPRVPSSHPTTTTTTTRTSSGLISPLLSPPLPSHSPRLQQQRSSGFQSSTGSSSDAYSYGYNYGYTSPRTPNNLDTLLERPYYDSPPDTAELRGQVEYVSPETTSEVPVSNGWSPGWLRRGVLSVFLATFGALAVVGEIVMWFLGRGDVEAVVEGLWTFMPIIISTILAILWSRVEFQALQYTPWIKLHPKPSTVDETRLKQAHRTVLLDYIGMNSFEALSTGFRSRHQLVVTSVVSSLLLRAQIVLSTGIFHAEVHADGSKYLKVRSGTLHTVAGVFCLLCMLMLPMMYHAPPRSGITPRDPTTLGGTAAVLASSKLFLSRLTGTGNAEMDTVAARLPGSWYTTEVRQRSRKPEEIFQLKQLSGGPMLFQDGGLERNKEEVGTYRPWTLGARVQSVSLAVSAVLLAGLWVIFGLWGDRNGFDTTGELYLIWTSVPTLMLVLLALFLSRIDVDTRRLAPFIELATQKCRFRESFGLTYVNQFGLTTAGKSFSRKHWAVFLKKWMAMLGWLMPIFTAGLFAIVELQQTAHLELRQETWFKSTSDSVGGTLNEQLVEDILIRKTPKYPTWTWEDLAFPELQIVDHGKEWPLPNTQLIGKVSAMRATLTCESATLSNGAGHQLECTSLDSDSETAICKGSNAAAGFVAASCSTLKTTHPINYIWGSCSDDGLMTILMCNETLVEVDVLSTFRTEDLSIDTNAIPLPDVSSERPANVTLDTSGAYEALSDIGSDDTTLDGLDGFFKTLVLSRLDMPLDRLMGEDRRNSVLVAIQTQHGILRAQALNSKTVRQPFTASGAPAAPSNIPVSVDYFIPRLKQSRVQTYVLAALLALTLALAALALRTIHPVTLPKNPGSIAAQASLLADSTIWWRLPDGAEYLSDEALAKCLRRKTFRLGWFNGSAGAGGTRNGVPERKYGISIVQDENKVARVELQGDSMFPGRYISMRPGLYGDIPFEKA